MLKGQHIICFGPGDWWGMNPSCTIHIVRRLAEQNVVLYVNPFSSDLLGARGQKRSGLAPRMARKVASLVKSLRKVGPTLFVYSPVFLPFQAVPLVDRVNNAAVSLQITVVARFLGMRRPILWVENVRTADILGSFHPSLILFHVSDLFTESQYVAKREALARRERAVLERSDLVICVSKRLHQLKTQDHPNVFYLPHGVDFELFRAAAKATPVVPELEGIPRPIAGYFGTLTDHNDIDMLLYCARRLSDIHFVFIGQITAGDYRPLAELPNVHFLGRMPYERIPEFCAQFDVCLLPWKVCDWIKSCNPLKLFEYMAAGKPVVSVDIDEVAQNYSGLVSIAHSKEEFCEAIVRELRSDNDECRNARISLASQHDWSVHLDQLSQIIKQVMPGAPDARRCPSRNRPTEVSP